MLPSDQEMWGIRITLRSCGQRRFHPLRKFQITSSKSAQSFAEQGTENGDIFLSPEITAVRGCLNALFFTVQKIALSLNQASPSPPVVLGSGETVPHQEKKMSPLRMIYLCCLFLSLFVRCLFPLRRSLSKSALTSKLLSRSSNGKDQLTGLSVRWNRHNNIHRCLENYHRCDTK